MSVMLPASFVQQGRLDRDYVDRAGLVGGPGVGRGDSAQEF